VRYKVDIFSLSPLKRPISGLPFYSFLFSSVPDDRLFPLGRMQPFVEKRMAFLPPFLFGRFFMLSSLVAERPSFSPEARWVPCRQNGLAPAHLSFLSSSDFFPLPALPDFFLILESPLRKRRDLLWGAVSVGPALKLF